MKRQVEFIILGAILLIGAWLRFTRLDLIEFKSDEAYAAQLALEFVQGGKLPTAGLMSSVGVTNPPLFAWLLIPMFFISSNVAAVSCMIAALGLGAVAATWWIGRKYYGPLTGLIAAALFAVSPWAVIYSRKIWAQDFVPVLAVATMWAAHAVVFGRKPKAVFWLLCLPLCLIQIHFSGFALTAVAIAILVLLRPKIDWRFAGAGVAVAVLLALPYVIQQQQTGWTEWQRVGGSGKHWRKLPPGVTINPNSGYPFPRSPANGWRHALAVMNTGEIEDVLGLSTSREFDPNGIWAGKGKQYFESALTFGDLLPGLQRLAFVAALVWLLIIVARARKGLFSRQVTLSDEAKRALILTLWFVVPLAAYLVGRLWTYVSYYVILYPVFFLALGMAAERLPRKLAVGAVVVFVAGNILFATDLYRFLDRHGGAQGTYGTGLGYKQQLAAFLASQADATQLYKEQRLLQMDHWQRAEPAQLELTFLASLAGKGAGIPTNAMVLIIDENRTSFDINRANFGPATNFGPMRLQLVQRP